DRSSIGIWSIRKARTQPTESRYHRQATHRTTRNLRLVSTTSSLAPYRRRTSYQATCINSKQLSQFRRRNKRLTLSAGSWNVAFHRIVRLVQDMQSGFLVLTYQAAWCYTVLNI